MNKLVYKSYLSLFGMESFLHNTHETEVGKI